MNLTNSLTAGHVEMVKHGSTQ